MPRHFQARITSSKLFRNPLPPLLHITALLACNNITPNHIYTRSALPHLLKRERAFATLTKPFLLFVDLVLTSTQRRTCIPERLRPVSPDFRDGLLERSLDKVRGQRSEQIHLIRRNQDRNFLWSFARCSVGVAFLQR